MTLPAGDIALALLAASPWIVAPAVSMWRIRRSRDLAELPADAPPDAPLVSVVIPARNERHNIEACVRSAKERRWINPQELLDESK